MNSAYILYRDLCEVRAGAEETVDDLKLKIETDCVVCEVRAEAEEAVEDQNITIEHDRLRIC
jgi:hypothetical protein